MILDNISITTAEELLNEDFNDTKKENIKYPKKFKIDLPLSYKVISLKRVPKSYFFVEPYIKGCFQCYQSIDSNRLFNLKDVRLLSPEEAVIVKHIMAN